MMDEQDIRTAIDRHWAASAAGDQVAEHEIYHDDAICTYPQSGEIIHGRRNLQALRSHHAGRPSGFEVRRIGLVGNQLDGAIRACRAKRKRSGHGGPPSL